MLQRPPEAILLGAQRWLRLLQRSSFDQAAALIRADAAFADLSVTQYSQGLDWLVRIGLVQDGSAGIHPSDGLGLISPSEADALLLCATLEASEPAWLPDADVLVQEAGDLPQDVITMANTLRLSDEAALGSVAMAYGKIDLEQRELVGSAGEVELIALLEAEWPGSTTHIAAEHDGFGYDVAFSAGARTWHLEVKSTTRRGRLVVHLSRHEHQVAFQDPAWKLVAVGLSGEHCLRCLATIDYTKLAARAPLDRHVDAVWEAVKYTVTPENLARGLPFTHALLAETGSSYLRLGAAEDFSGFAWMPNEAVS